MNLIKLTTHKFACLACGVLLTGSLLFSGCAPVEEEIQQEETTSESSTMEPADSGAMKGPDLGEESSEPILPETEPEVTEPEATEPEPAEPETTEPEVTEPVEEPVEETPAEEKPMPTEEPTPEPSEEPETTEPAPSEEPAAEEPVTDEPATEEPATEEPATEEPAAEESPKEETAEAAPAEEESVEVAAVDAAATEAKSDEKKIAGDWPTWGGDYFRNMVNSTKGINLDLGAQDINESNSVKWTSNLGSQTYGNPVVGGGKVLVGTNNGAEYRPQHVGDRGVVLCFDESSGDMLWQLTREKLEQGRVNDWPEQGICSTPCIEDGKMYVVTNRAEVMCVDMEGFHDGENDGPYTEEADTEEMDADIIWSLDMINDLGVFPHNLATSSPLIYKDRIFLLTSNGVDEAHLEIPAPRAPCFLCIDKNSGEVIWEDNTPFDQILHGQWGSPAIGIVNDQAQVYFPGGDGWIYAFEAEADEANLIWKFDMNPKDSEWILGGRGTRNAIISTPVFLDNSIVVGVGQDPEHGEGIGHLYRIDATKTGDVTSVNEDGTPNENSGEIWHYGGVDTDGEVTGEEGAEVFRRTISTVAIHDGLVYAADLSGRLHCVDFKTGKRHWEYDLFAAVWGSPMVVDGKVLIGDEDGDLAIFNEGAELDEDAIVEYRFESSIYSTPTIANGVMYVTDRSHLYAIPIMD